MEDIFKYLKIFATLLPEEYIKRPAYLNKYFEIMNSNFKNLNPHEILKTILLNGQDNKICLLQIWNMCEDFSKPLYTPKSGSNSKKDKAEGGDSLKSNFNFYNYLDGARKNLNSHIKKYEDKSHSASSSNSNPANAENAAGKKELLFNITAKPAPQKKDRAYGERSIINFPQFLLLALDIYLQNKHGAKCASNPPASENDANNKSGTDLGSCDNPKADNDPEEAARKFYNVAHLLKTYGHPEPLLIQSDEVPEFYEFLFVLRALLDFYVIRRFDDVLDTYSVMCGNTHPDHDPNENLWNPAYPGCCLAQYQAMLDVAFPENFYKWLAPYLSKLYSDHFEPGENCKSNPSPQELLDRLKDWDNERVFAGKPMTPTELNGILAADNLTYRKADRYWFWRLDYYLWEMSNDVKSFEQFFKEDQLPAINEYRMRANRSIEHLFPQNSGDNSDALKDWPDREQINSFGNLAMISSSFNSTQGNANVALKFTRVGLLIDRKTLQSLKLLVMHNESNGEGTKWTQNLAKKHEADMIEILKKSFKLAQANVNASNESG